MAEILAYTLDKFTFTVATDRHYSSTGVWAKADGDRIMVGVSDFFQQHNGDVAFAEVLPEGTVLAVGDGFVIVETMKVSLELACPVAGIIVAVNKTLELEAERINQDPYGDGWLAAIEATDWTRDKARLMTPAAYFEHMKAAAQKEV